MVGVDEDRAIEWLLEKGDPPLRYRVLTELQGEPLGGRKATKARRTLMETGPVVRVLSSQQPGGHWGREEDFYVRTKYHGTVWNLILLADLAADPADLRVRKAGDFILRWSRRSDGGFTHRGGPGGGTGGHMACLDGNMVSSLVRLGFRDDPRLLLPFEHLYQLARELIPLGGGRCLDCRTGMVKLLKGLDHVPAHLQSPDHSELRDKLAEKIASLCLTGKGPRPEWMQLSFPLMWNTDLIEILDLVRPPRSDPRAAAAIEFVCGKQDENGWWKMEGGFGSRCLASFGHRGTPSPWVTFRALSMLRRLPD